MKKLLMVLMMIGMLVSADAQFVGGDECSSGGKSYWYDGKCHQCPRNQQWNDKTKKCVDTSATTAGATTTSNKCPANATCPGGVDDFLCNFGYYRKSKDAKTCTKCPQTADKCIGDVILCKPGYYLTDKRTCAKCLAGYRCAGQIMPPKPCETGMYAPAGSKKCLPCPDNTYTPEKKATKCTPCPKNAKCYLNKFYCNDGYYRTSEKAKICTKCPAGYMCPSGGSRVKCPAGTYTPAGSHMCSICSGNTYSSAGAAKCKSCPKGQKPNEKHTACVKA